MSTHSRTSSDNIIAIKLSSDENFVDININSPHLKNSDDLALKSDNKKRTYMKKNRFLRFFCFCNNDCND